MVKIIHLFKFYCLIVFLLITLTPVAWHAYAQPVTAADDTFSIPGGPSPGAITDGVLTRPQNTDEIEIISILPQVTRIRIEQSDMLVTQTGPNPNQVFFDGPPIDLIGMRFNLRNIQSVRFTVEVSGNERIPQAVVFRWIFPS